MKFLELPIVDVVPSVSLNCSVWLFVVVSLLFTVSVSEYPSVCESELLVVCVSEWFFDFAPILAKPPASPIAPPAAAIVPAPPAAATPVATTAGNAAPPVAATTATVPRTPPTTANPLPIFPHALSLDQPSVTESDVPSVCVSETFLVCDLEKPSVWAVESVSDVPFVLLMALANDSFVE